jgi:hypothetical protein
MEVADHFLHQPKLALPAPSSDKKSPDSKKLLNQSHTSFNSNMTGLTSGTHRTNFMALNKDRAKDFNPYKKPMICDTLDEQSKSRLGRLMEDIDEDLDSYLKKKEEFEKLALLDDRLTAVKTADPDNAYNYSKHDVDRIEKINESLMKVAPMLPPPSDTASNLEYQPPTMSALKQKLGGGQDFDHSKFLDNQSMLSVPMSTATRKTNLTMLTH